MRWTPHALIEGCAIARLRHRRRDAATSTSAASSPSRWTIMRAAVDGGVRRRAPSARTRWAPASGSTWCVHRGAGAYICGEETALMNSLEGKRGNPRIKPPFPAVAGVFGMPTTINNVETLAAVPHILKSGADVVQGVSASATRRAPAPSCISVCGHIQRPGNYEVTMGFPFKEFLYDLCGGPRPGRKFKAIIPGGISVPIMTREEAEAALMDYEGFVAQGLDARLRRRDRDRRHARHGRTRSARLARFFAHESCAQCTQCREGTAWTTKILERILAGTGQARRISTRCSRSPRT